MPFLDAPPIPENNPSGTDTTKAQGHETTRNDNALYIHVEKSASFTTKGGITAIATAKKTTTGV